MPIAVKHVEQLQEYVRGVMRRADHHAGNVDEIALTIAGAIIWRTEDEIEVRGQDGEMKNVLWIRIGVNRYALSYNHDSGEIEVRERSTHGDVIASFSNETPNTAVKTFFGQL